MIIDLIMGKMCNFCNNEVPSKHIAIVWTEDSEPGWYSAYCDRDCLRNAMNKFHHFGAKP